MPKLIGLAPSNTFPSSMAHWNAGSMNSSSSKAEPDAASFRQRRLNPAQPLLQCSSVVPQGGLVDSPCSRRANTQEVGGVAH